MARSSSASDSGAVALADLITAIGDRFARLEADEVSDTLAVEDVQRLMTVAVRVYAALGVHRGEPVDPIPDSVGPTEAMMVAQALLDHHQLSLFDMAAWSHRAPTSSREGHQST